MVNLDRYQKVNGFKSFGFGILSHLLTTSIHFFLSVTEVRTQGKSMKIIQFLTH